MADTAPAPAAIPAPPPLQLLDGDAAGYCDPETGFCVLPDAATPSAVTSSSGKAPDEKAPDEPVTP